MNVGFNNGLIARKEMCVQNINDLEFLKEKFFYSSLDDIQIMYL